MALTLSQLEIFRRSSPELASQIAQIFSGVLEDEEIQKLLADKGINPRSLLDAPLTARGIALSREQEKDLINRPYTGSVLGETFAGVQRGAAQFLDQFGAARPLAEAFPGGGFGGLEPPPPENLINIAGFEVEPTAIASNIALSLIPYAGVAGKLAPLTQGMTNPLTRGAVTYAGVFGGLEAARQAGRAISEGESIDPTQLAAETIIGAASGVPLGTGLPGRLRTAGLTGAAAAATNVIPGVETTPARVGTEMLFAALFPASELPTIRVPLDQSEVLLKEAQEVMKIPAERVREATTARLARMSDEDIKRMVSEGVTDEAVLDQLFASRETLTSKFLGARAAAAKKLSALPEDALLTLMRGEGPEAVFASDALAFKLKATKEGDAPPIDPIPPKEVKLGDLDHPETARAVAENEALFVIRERLSPIREQEIPIVKPASDVPEIISESIIKPEIPQPVPPRLRVNMADNARLTLFSEYQTRINELRNNIDAVQARVDKAKGKLTSQDRVELLRTRKEIELLQKKSDQLLDVKSPVQVDNLLDAIRVTKALTNNMSRKQLNAFKKDLPDFLKPWESEIQTSLVRPKGVAPPELTSVDFAIGKLREDGVLQGPAGDLSLKADKQSNTLKRLTLTARLIGGDIKVEDGQFILNLKGQSTKFKTLKEAFNRMDNFVRGIADDPVTLDEAAAKRGMSASHIGDGVYRVVDHVEGTIQDVNSPAEAAEVVNSVPLRDAIAPHLTTPTDVEIPGTSTSGRLYRSESRPAAAFIELDEYTSVSRELPKDTKEALRILPPKLNKYLDTTKEALIKIQEALPQIPVYSELFEPMTRLISLRQQFIQPHMKELRKIFRSVSPTRMNAIQDTFLARGNTRETMAQWYRLNGAERRAVEGLDKWYGKLLGLNEEGVSELAKGMGAYRAAAGDPRRALGNYMQPRVMEIVRESLDNGKFRADGSNADEVASSLLFELANQRFRINELVKRAEDMRFALRSMASKSGLQTPEGKFIDSAEHVLGQYINTTTDRADLAARAFSETVDKKLTPWFRAIGKAFGNERRYLRNGKFISQGDLDRLATMYTTWQSGIAMSGRMALAFRNLFQSLLVAPKVGFGRTFASLGKAMNILQTPELYKKARAAGVIDDTGGVVFFDDALKEVNEGFFRAAMRVGMTPYRGADAFNRVVTFIAGHDAVQEFAPKYLTNKSDSAWSKFLLDTGLAGDSKVVQDLVRSKLLNRGVDEAAEYYGRHIAQDSQFLYSKNNLPEWMTNRWGRVFGQFGIWPVAWTNYMRRNAFGAVSSDPITRFYSRQFIAKYGMMWFGLAAAGAAVGVDTSGWQAGTLFTFEGGPALQTLRDGANVIFGGSDYARKKGLSGVTRSVKELMIPFGALVTDLQQAGQEQDAGRKLFTALGFNLTEPELAK